MFDQKTSKGKKKRIFFYIRSFVFREIADDHGKYLFLLLNIKIPNFKKPWLKVIDENEKNLYNVKL